MSAEQRSNAGGAFSRPVSYTHLDVYKRQEKRLVERMGDNDAGETVEVEERGRDTECGLAVEGGGGFVGQEDRRCLLYTSRCV